MSEKQRHDSDYLWDPGAEPDPEVQRLEKLLSPLAYDAKARAVVPLRRRRVWPQVAAVTTVLAAAAVLLVIVMRGGGSAKKAAAPRPDGGAADHSAWAVTQLDGAPVCDGKPLAIGSAMLGLGESLFTDAASRAEIAGADIGTVTVEPNSEVKLVTSTERERRLALARGAIHAEINAPPRLFWVDTPSAIAIDYGCAYHLRVNDDGSSVLAV